MTGLKTYLKNIFLRLRYEPPNALPVLNRLELLLEHMSTALKGAGSNPRRGNFFSFNIIYVSFGSLLESKRCLILMQ
jgi:hypothetical protein